MPPTIHIDFDVFKAITARRQTESVTENDVLRQMFGLSPSEGRPSTATEEHRPGDWISKGVRFPQGTLARATYKGRLYLAEVKEGSFVYNGRRYDSPSAAAMKITLSPVNGWTFWEVKLPGQGEWQQMKAVRENREPDANS